MVTCFYHPSYSVKHEIGESWSTPAWAKSKTVSKIARERQGWIIPLLGIYPKDRDSGYSRGTCTPMFIAALFTIAKLWKQPRCPLLTNGLRKCGIYTQWNFIQL
jgi:hypothetical protein